MECLSSHGSRNCPIRADDPQIKSQQLRNRARECVPSSSDKQNFYPHRMSVAKRLKVNRGNLKLGSQQGAININGQKADRRSHCKDSSIVARISSQTNIAETT